MHLFLQRYLSASPALVYRVRGDFGVRRELHVAHIMARQKRKFDSSRFPPSFHFVSPKSELRAAAYRDRAGALTPSKRRRQNRTGALTEAVWEQRRRSSNDRNLPSGRAYWRVCCCWSWPPQTRLPPSRQKPQNCGLRPLFPAWSRQRQLAAPLHSAVDRGSSCMDFHNSFLCLEQTMAARPAITLLDKRWPPTPWGASPTRVKNAIARHFLEYLRSHRMYIVLIPLRHARGSVPTEDVGGLRALFVSFPQSLSR